MTSSIGLANQYLDLVDKTANTAIFPRYTIIDYEYIKN